MNHEEFSKRVTPAWIAGLLSTILSTALAALLVRTLGKADGLNAIETAQMKDLFRAHLLPFCQPEPGEFLGYAIFLVSWIPIFLFVYHTGCSRFRVQALLKTNTVFSNAFFIIFILFVAGAWSGYFRIYPVEGITGLTLAAFGYWITNRPKYVPARYLFFSLIACAWALFHAIFTEGSLAEASHTVKHHLPYAYNEFIPVLAGRTPLVDFHPQYVRILSFLSVPVFSLFRFNIESFTLLMLFLNLLALLAMARVIYLLFKNKALAAVVFLSFLGFAVFKIDSQYLSSVTYNALGPMRTFGPWLTLWICAEQIARPRPWCFVATVAAGTLTALNNLDFGVPVWVGTSFALFLQTLQQSTSSKESASRRHLLVSLRSVGLRIGSVTLAIALPYFFWLYTRSSLASGELPQWNRIFEYQRIFAKYGFFMIALPSVGFYFMVIAAHLFALASGLVFRDPWAPFRAGVAVFGLGTLSYYVGRSHPQVLPTTFGPMALSVATLGALATTVRVSRSTRASLALCLVLGLRGFPTPAQQLEKWASLRGPVSGTKNVSDFEQELNQVRSYILPGTQVLLMQPSGHRIAHELGLKNIFPFASEGSLILKSQFDEALAVVRKKQVHWVAFSEAEADLIKFLSQEHFRLEFQRGSIQYWKRSDSGSTPGV